MSEKSPCRILAVNRSGSVKHPAWRPTFMPFASAFIAEAMNVSNWRACTRKTEGDPEVHLSMQYRGFARSEHDRQLIRESFAALGR